MTRPVCPKLDLPDKQAKARSSVSAIGTRSRNSVGIFGTRLVDGARAPRLAGTRKSRRAGAWHRATRMHLYSASSRTRKLPLEMRWLIDGEGIRCSVTDAESLCPRLLPSK